ncbi:MAG: phenylpyruvate tautomerase MIF-related protein [Verrucomicrobiota bacterium]
MPLVRLLTNTPLAKGVEIQIAKRATSIAAEAMGKPETVTMAVVESDVTMTFGGTTDPTALFELEGIELAAEPTESMCQRFSDLAEEVLEIPASRVFVKQLSVPRGRWAGNRKVY